MNASAGPQPASEREQRERIRTVIHANADAAAAVVAGEMAALIRGNAAAGRRTVLGLPTGSTPVRLYRQLIRLHREEGLSFRSVVTFNLDEYHGLPRGHSESYWRFMREQLFDQIDMLPANAHVPDGTVQRADVYAWCRGYEAAIREAGGIDLQILGIGRTGHIGFNEPGSGRESPTRLVTLDALTRRDAARDFRGEANVPRHAVTMGVGTILGARRIALLAWGDAKARVIAEAVEGPPSEALPASFLQGHPSVAFHLDGPAASALTRVCHPWLVGPVEWDPPTTRRAIVWLSQQLKKPVLKLLDEDYSEHGMADLLTEQGPAYGLNIRIFNELQHTITGWPGGKPRADDAHRPERALPHPKRVLIFSPEPLDDVLGMGGTLRRLVDQGHEVTVVYQTSGNLGVPDEEVAAAADLLLEVSRIEGGMSPGAAFAQKVRRQLESKGEFDPDTPEIRRLKSTVRRGEARASLRACGLEAGRVRFLDLPFYEKGKYRQFQIEDGDVAAVAAVLREARPHQVFATGSSTDPSSLPAVCFEILSRALAATEGEAWRSDCRVWLYRGLERPCEPSEVEMAVPLSPSELEQKLQAIFHHKSQRSQQPTSGVRQDESWQRAGHHNRAVAQAYDGLGLAQYEAIETFQRWRES